MVQLCRLQIEQKIELRNYFLRWRYTALEHTYGVSSMMFYNAKAMSALHKIYFRHYSVTKLLRFRVKFLSRSLICNQDCVLWL